MTETPARDQLRAHLITARIAGEVATTRQNNLENFARMSRGEPLYRFGLNLTGRWSYEDVLALMAQRCGVVPDPGHVRGQDTIDPDRTLDRLDAMADRIGLAAQRRERVLIATGHPAPRQDWSKSEEMVKVLGAAALEGADLPDGIMSLGTY